jgi:hypothetical protein
MDKLEELELERLIAERLGMWENVIKIVKEIEKIGRIGKNNSNNSR